MFTLIITDAVVASEPQIKMAKSGSSYVEYRAVCHEKEKDYWFTCRSSYSNVVSFVKAYVKKGSRVHMTGSYDNDTYVNNQQAVAISNNLWVQNISFANSGNTNSNKGDGTKTEENSGIDDMTSDAPQPEKPKPEGLNGDKTPKQVEDVPADDLPF